MEHLSLPFLRNGCLILEEVDCISVVEEDRSEHRVDLGVTPMLAQNVSRVHVTKDVVKGDHLGCDSFPSVMEGQHLVSLAEIRVWDGTTGDYGLVVSEEIRSLPKVDSEIT